MVAVIYRWRLPQSDLSQFAKIWRETTSHIHKTVKGAKGSTLFRSLEDEQEVYAIAKWSSYEDWLRFWNKETPVEMEHMHLIAERVSVEVLSEVDDCSFI
ncbi:antibiotic biosynthesis monooxygenase family protein [Planctobacterium marinum]|uniref:antibiotic biosynthesis monooxygenase family protein n=1 Tax=Planctobacterium marinum TaxID=1631968 RepID=UPI001E60A07A|nr:antibiotic biosynthesis monooxygenase [Planctobacterium marinum]MCC2605710.1 antibiotic biosynthesis monooxygenase [Planctobacterium marinum]